MPAHVCWVLAALDGGGDALPCKPHELLMGKSAGTAVLGGVASLPDTAQICACNNVTKGAIYAALSDQDLTSVGQIKTCTRAGTGCGGCLPLVTDLFNAVMQSAGKTVTYHLCEHFAYSRTELFALIKTKQLKTFEAVLHHCGSGNGCGICKPAITPIFAALWNEHIL